MEDTEKNQSNNDSEQFEDPNVSLDTDPIQKFDRDLIVEELNRKKSKSKVWQDVKFTL